MGTQIHRARYFAGGEIVTAVHSQPFYRNNPPS